MTQERELRAVAEQLEQLVTQLALLSLATRRLVDEITKPPEPQQQRPDFNWQTGMPPEKKERQP